MSRKGKKEIMVYSSIEDYEKIRELANAANMSLSTYLKESALANKEIVVKEEVTKNITLKVETNDLFGLLGEIRELREKINSISGVILKTGKIYEREMKEIMTSIETMEDIMNQKTFLVLEDRKRIKKEAQRIIEKEKNKK